MTTTTASTSLSSAERELNWSSPDSILTHSRNWTLADDAGLLKYLEKQSDELFQKTAAVHSQLDDVLLEAERSNTCLRNVNNRFLQLANSQFIENRVYDDDVLPVSSVKEENKDKSKAEREAEMVANVKSAVEMGTALLDTHFHKIEIRPQDFDEDDDPTFRPEPLFEPLDPYVNRPLPAVIGTAEFEKWDHIGLKEDQMENEERLELEPDRDLEETIVVSMGRNEEEKVPVSVPVPKARSIDIQQQANSDSSGMFGGESEDDLFSKHSSEEGGIVQPKTPPRATPEKVTKQDLLKSELSARLSVPDRSGAAKNIQQKVESEDEDDEDLFGAPPPLVSAAEAKFLTITNTGLFETRTEGVGLFDDEEDDIFSPIKSKSKSAALYSDLPPPDLKTKVQEKKVEIPKAVPKKETSGRVENKVQERKVNEPTEPSGGGLFGEEESDDDDIFAIPSKKKLQPKSKTEIKISDSKKSTAEKAGERSEKKSSLFGDEEEEESGHVRDLTFDSKKSAGPTVLVEKGGGCDLFDDESDEDDLFAVIEKKSNKKGQPQDKSASVFTSDCEKKMPSSSNAGDLFSDVKSDSGSFAVGISTVIKHEDKDRVNEFSGQSVSQQVHHEPARYGVFGTKGNEEVTEEGQGDYHKENFESKPQSERDEGKNQKEIGKLNWAPVEEDVIAGIRKNLENKKEVHEARIEEDSADATDDRGMETEQFSDSYVLLPSLSKTRAKVPSSTRRPPSRKPAPASNQVVSEDWGLPPESPPPLPVLSLTEETIDQDQADNNNSRIRVFDPLTSGILADETASEGDDPIADLKQEIVGDVESRSIVTAETKGNSVPAQSLFEEEDVEDIFADETGKSGNKAVDKSASEEKAIDRNSDPLFGEQPNTRTSKPPPILKDSSIVDSDSEEDIFAPRAVTDKRRQKEIKSSTENSSSKDILAPRAVSEKGKHKEVKRATEETTSSSRKSQPLRNSLFGDNDDDDSDLDIFK